MQIVSTEYGYVSGTAISISAATAAYYLNWAEYLSYKQPRLQTYSQYLLLDPSNNGFTSGLESPSGVHKATYAAYRMPIYMPITSGRTGASLEVWGAIRPAVNYGSPTAEIQFQPTGGAFSSVATVTSTNRRAYFDSHVAFPGSGMVRLAWTYPSGPLAGSAIYSRTVQIAEK